MKPKKAKFSRTLDDASESFRGQSEFDDKLHNTNLESNSLVAEANNRNRRKESSRRDKPIQLVKLH